MIVATLLALLPSLPAFAGPAPIAGIYAFAHEITFVGDFSARECREAGGHWMEGNCRVPVSDYVVLDKSRDGFAVQVSTVTTNGHGCELKGMTVAGGAHELVAVSGTGEGCRLSLRFHERGLMSVARLEPEACTELCASNEGLEIVEARKIK